jgi:hypothetical protein
LEIVHGGAPLPLGALPVAWTVDDDVFVRTGDTTEREDGYILIGQLDWDDTPDDRAVEYNIERLRTFVSAWRKENGK